MVVGSLERKPELAYEVCIVTDIKPTNGANRPASGKERDGLNSTDNKTNTKLRSSINRCFLLSYNTEFDSFRFPILLYYREMDDADELKRVIIEMRGKPDLSRSQHHTNSLICEDKVEVEFLRAENDRLKQKVQELEAQRGRMGNMRLSAVEKEGLYARVERLEREKEEILAEQKEEIIVLCEKIEQLTADLAAKNKEISDLKKGKGGRSYASGNIQALSKEVEGLKKDLEVQKKKDGLLARKNKTLEDELRELKRKMATTTKNNIKPAREGKSIGNRAFSIKSSSSTINQQKLSGARKTPSQARPGPTITQSRKSGFKAPVQKGSGNVLPNRNYIAMNNNFLKRTQSQKSRNSTSKLSFINTSQQSRQSFNSFVSKGSKLSKAPSISKGILNSKTKAKIDDSFEKRRQRFEQIKQGNKNGPDRHATGVGKVKMEKFKAISNRLGELEKLKRN